MSNGFQVIAANKIVRHLYCGSYRLLTACLAISVAAMVLSVDPMPAQEAAHNTFDGDGLTHERMYHFVDHIL